MNYGSEPQSEELAKLVRIHENQMERLLRVHRHPRSMNQPILRNGTQNLSDLVPDSCQENPGEKLDQELLKRRLKRTLKSLDSRERQVILLRFGLQGERPLTQTDIGKMMCVSKERIRQIEESAMSKLRQPQRASQFEGPCSLRPRGICFRRILFSPRCDLPVTTVQVAATRVLGIRKCAVRQSPFSLPPSMYPYGSENPGGVGAEPPHRRRRERQSGENSVEEPGK